MPTLSRTEESVSIRYILIHSRRCSQRRVKLIRYYSGTDPRQGSFVAIKLFKSGNTIRRMLSMTETNIGIWIASGFRWYLRGGRSLVKLSPFVSLVELVIRLDELK
jgi:hypothetical protein